MYHHKTDGGAEYLTDKYVLCPPDGHKEGIFEGATVVIRLDGDPKLVRNGDQSTNPAKQVATVTVRDPDSGLDNEVVIYLEASGNMTGVDASYVEQDIGPVHSSVGNGVLELEGE